MKSQRRSSKKRTTKRLTSNETPGVNSIESISLVNGSETQLFGYQNQLKYLSKIVNNTIETGESNSVLICGDPGSGKSTLLETYLRQIESNTNVAIIRLNGLINANDSTTIKTIGRHLAISATSIPDIMDGLKNKCSKNKQFRLVIILDKFDVFCRRNQTLLYNLLDVLQHSNAICIIGMTTRLDSIDLLEKRVKSRLNQRIIHLTSPFDNFDDYIHCALNLLNQKQLSESLRKSLEIQFEKNLSIRELRRLLSEYKISEATELPMAVSDTKHVCLSQLSKYEISVLLVANKYTKNQNRNDFHCSAIMDAFKHLPQIKINKRLLFAIIYRLLETDLISRQSSLKTNDLLLTEWTRFRLNIDDSHLDHILSSNSFPNYIKNI